MFEGLCAFADPPKASAPAAIARLAAAGVRLVILVRRRSASSSDVSPALVGLRAERICPAAESNALSDDALRGAGPIDRRLRPAGARPEVADRPRPAAPPARWSAFIGDGINDAPALKAADIGLSVEGATGVAQAAADMILLASDLEVVADGVEEGRRTFANILKYVRMGASSNFGNMLSMAVASHRACRSCRCCRRRSCSTTCSTIVSEIGIPFDNVRADKMVIQVGSIIVDLCIDAYFSSAQTSRPQR